VAAVVVVATESIGDNAQKSYVRQRNNPYEVYWSRWWSCFIVID